MKTIMHWLRNSSRRNVGDDPPAFRPSMVGLPLNVYIYIYVYNSLRWGNRRLYKLLFLLFFRLLVFFCMRLVMVHNTDYRNNVLLLARSDARTKSISLLQELAEKLFISLNRCLEQ